MIVSLSINAQVQRNFFGLTLGVTSTESTADIFNKKNMPFEIDPNYIYRYSYYNNFVFGGVTYEMFYIDYVDNKFAAISLVINGKNFEDVKKIYDIIKHNVVKKYKPYGNVKITEKTYPIYVLKFSDKNTWAECVISSRNQLCLVYGDKKLLNIKD